MALYQGGPGPMPARESLLELLPRPNEIRGRETAIEVNAPERADVHILFDPPELLSKAEEGLAKKNVEEAMLEKDPETGQLVIYQKIRAEFNANRDGLLHELIGKRELAEWEAGNRKAIDILKEMQSALTLGGQNAMQELRGGMNMLRMGGNNEVGAEASRSLAKMIDEITEEKKITKEQMRTIKDRLQALIELQIGVEETLSMIGESTRYSDLNAAAKAQFWRLYYNRRWTQEEGTKVRNEFLARLCMRRGAPMAIMPGWERKVYQNIFDVKGLKDELKATDDPVKRSAIEARIEEIIKDTEPGVSAITHIGERAFEPGPTGEEQIKNGAWAEIRDTVDGIVREPGKGVILISNATYDQASWESVGMKTEIYFQFGVAKNAIKHLGQIDADTFAERFKSDKKDTLEFQIEDDDQKLADAMAELKSFDSKQSQLTLGKEEVQKQLEDAEAEAKDLEQQVKDSADEAKRELEAAKAAAEAEAQAAQANANNPNQGTGNQRRGKDKRSFTSASSGPASTLFNEQMKLWQKARDNVSALKERLLLIQAEIDRKEEEREKILQKIRAIRQLLNLNRTKYFEIAKVPPSQQPQDPSLANTDIKPNPYIDTPLPVEDYRRQKAKNLYSDLLKRLQEFVNQEMYDTSKGKEFDGRFNSRDKAIIAALNGMDFDQSAGRFAVKRAELGLVKGNQDELANSTETDTNPEGQSKKKEIPDFDGDYCFIDGWKIGEQAGRTSPEALRQALDSGRFPEIEALVADAKAKGKTIIVTSFGVSHDASGRMIGRVVHGAGPEFKEDVAKEMMKLKNWSPAELFNAWLDDLEIQRMLGVRPEEVEEAYMANQVRNHQFREKHFSGKDGWTFINSAISSDTLNFFEATIRRMRDAGLDLTSHELRKAPFFQKLGKSNEYAITIVDDKLGREVRYKDDKFNSLTASPEAPQTLVARFKASIMGKLELYMQRFMIGGQFTSQMGTLDEDQELRLGAWLKANKEFIKKKIQTLNAITDNSDATPEEKLALMQDFREKELIHLSYDILDENGQPVESNANPDLWADYNANIQWLGKLKRNLRFATKEYATAISNPNATQADIEAAEDNYYFHVSTRRNFEIETRALAKQASGEWTGKSAAEVSKFFARSHAKITGEEMLNLQEEQMRAQFLLDFGSGGGMMKPLNNIARRLVGKLAKNRLADFGRSIGSAFGLGNQFLREEDIGTIERDIRLKFDSNTINRAAAHYAHAVQTGYQNDWSGIFHPEGSTRLVKAGELPGVQMSPTGSYLMKKLEQRIEEDIGDAIDRTLANNMEPMMKVAKRRGWNVEEMMKTYLEARMNDTQAPTNENGIWMTDHYGNLDLDTPDPLNPRPKDRGKGTRISQLERVFMRKVRNEMNRSGWTLRTPSIINPGIAPSPDYTRVRNDARAPIPLVRQRYRHDPSASTADPATGGIDPNGTPIPLAGGF